VRKLLRVDRPAESSTCACGHVPSPLTPFLVAFDRSADYLSSCGVGCVKW
jgi:hypothetical protein